MDFKLSTILYATVVLLLISSYSHAASTTNGKLLKFYPITKEQYRSILALARQQPAISETHLTESHRSLADWSNTLHNSWNRLFNGTNRPSTQSNSKVYPICVIKTKDPIVRRKRDAVQNQYEANYAGLAPNVVYPTSSYYGIPPYNGYTPYGRENEGENGTDRDDEVVGDNEEVEAEKNNEGIDDIIAEIDDNYNDGSEKDTPTINCVVVLRRKNQDAVISPHPIPEEEEVEPEEEEEDENSDDNVDDEDDDDDSPYQHPPYHQHPYPYPYPYPHPHAPQYPYPPPIPPHGHYPHPHIYPPHPYETSRNFDDALLRSNQYPVLNPDAAVHYQEILREYYKHLQAFYMADAATGSQTSNEEKLDSSDDAKNDKDNKKQV